MCRGRLPICLSIVFPKLVQPREVIDRLKRDNWLLCLFDRKLPVPACSAKSWIITEWVTIWGFSPCWRLPTVMLSGRRSQLDLRVSPPFHFLMQKEACIGRRNVVFHLDTLQCHSIFMFQNLKLNLHWLQNSVFSLFSLENTLICISLHLLWGNSKMND